jgi:hypothetical protein
MERINDVGEKVISPVVDIHQDITTVEREKQFEGKMIR